MKKTKVIMISAEECKECSEVKKKIETVFSEEKIAYEMETLIFSTDRAIQVAIEFGLDTLPSFVVNKTGFNGKIFSKEALLVAAKE